jgi:hypothetical protein
LLDDAELAGLIVNRWERTVEHRRRGAKHRCCHLSAERTRIAPSLRSGVAGELRFYEHVRAARQPLRGFLDVADKSGFWPWVGGGCHPARDTQAAIEAAGFRIERLERFGFSPSPVIPNIPHILGVARRAD